MADLALTSAASSGEHKFSYLGWRVVLASMIALAFGPSTVAVMNFGLFIRPLEAAFRWPRTDVALATTIVSYMIVVISPLQGYLIDRFGARRVILPSIPAFALGIGALYLMPAVHWIYYAAWVIIPFLGVGLFPLAYLKVVSTWFRDRLGLALGIANSGIGIGGAIIPIFAGGVIAAYGWRGAYLGLAVIVLFVTWPIAWLCIREKPFEARGAAAASQPGMEYREAARTAEFRLMALAFFLLGVINTALIVHQVPLLIDAGVTPQRAALVQTVYGLSSLVGRLLTGILLDLIAAPLVMMIFAGGTALACGMYAAGVSGNIAFLCAALIGLAFGAEFDVLGYMVKFHFGLRSFGRTYGTIFAIFQFGAGFGAAVLPITRDHFGSYGPGLWAFAAVTLMSAVAMFRIGRSGPVAQVGGAAA